MRTTTTLSHILTIAVILSCYCFVTTVGFQSSTTMVVQRQLGHHDSYPHGRKRQQLQSSTRFYSSIFAKKTTSSSALHAFNLNNNNLGNDLGPIKDWKDVLQRLKLVALTVFKQFISGYMTGYLLAVFWGIIRPTHLDRGMLWGFDFGALSAIFNGCSAVTELFFLGGGSSVINTNSNDDDNNKRIQAINLWNVVIRNMMLAIYFGRNSGLVRMIRSAVLYGGMTYYFVSKKNKRDATMRMDMFQNMMGGGGGQSSMPNPQQAAMQELLQRLSKNPTTTSFTTTTTTRPSQQQRPSSSPSNKKPSSTSPLNANNIVDVEFEKVNKEDDVNGEDK